MWEFKDYQCNIALIDESGRKITYEELNALQRFYCSCMRGERVLTFLICETSIESILIYIACIQNRIPVMILDNQMSKDKIEELLETYQPGFVWYFGEPNYFSDYKPDKKFNGFQLYRGKQHSMAVHEDLALLLLTSGSTGSRKSVRISYENIRANMDSIAQSLSIRETDAAMLMLPMCYSYGLSVINSNLASGAALLVPKSRFFSTTFWGFFGTYEGTSICGVPYTYEVLRKLKFREKRLPSLRLITQAGGALGIEDQKYLLDYADSRGIDLAIMYGQTEATARISCYFLNRHREKLGCVGKVIPGGKIEIRQDDQGEGEIVYSGENVTLGYAESFIDLVKGDENKGALYTGDIGYLDEDGYLYITGRKNRIAKVLGVRTNLDELQNALSEKTGIRTVCVEGAGKLYAFTEGESGEELIYSAAKELGIDYRLFRVVRVEGFPRKDNGKIAYRELEETAVGMGGK